MENKEDSSARIRDLYRSNAIFRDVFDFFNARGDDSDPFEVNLDRLELSVRAKSGQKYSRSELVKVLYFLHNQYLGVFKVGRRGHPSRFKSETPLADIGKMAAGIDISSDADMEETTRPEPSSTLRHVFILRPDLTIQLDLPRDLTTIEAGRIAEFAKTLPFNCEIS
jgi:hypothetical protein